MSGYPTNRHQEFEQIFGRVLPLIDAALLQHYGLSRSEASEVEDCLRDWFHGFVRRPGTPCTLDQLRPHLLSMACNAGHVYWSGKVSGEVPLDGNVQRSLTLGPQRIAVELEKTLQRRERWDDDPGKWNH